MLVTDAAGYTAALGMGYVLTATPPVISGVPLQTPSTGAAAATSVNPTGGGPVIVDTSVNPQQPDPDQPVPQG